MAALPWSDPQFLVVTLVALLAGALALRPFLARRRNAGSAPACPRCAHCAAATKPASQTPPVVRIGSR
jgi:hypothetical protein